MRTCVALQEPRGQRAAAVVAFALGSLLCATPEAVAAEPAIRVGPFIQSVLGTEATVLWFSDAQRPGTVRYGLAADKLDRTATSRVRAMPTDARRKAAFAHEAVLTDLPPGRDVYYRVTDPEDPAGVACFRSDPGPSGTVTFICGGDEG